MGVEDIIYQSTSSPTTGLFVRTDGAARCVAAAVPLAADALIVSVTTGDGGCLPGGGAALAPWRGDW
ncbi:hypothetical protein PANO111632_05815 [Paracoccus nototheniae]